MSGFLGNGGFAPGILAVENGSNDGLWSKLLLDMGDSFGWWSETDFGVTTGEGVFKNGDGDETGDTRFRDIWGVLRGEGELLDRTFGRVGTDWFDAAFRG